MGPQSQRSALAKVMKKPYLVLCQEISCNLLDIWDSTLGIAEIHWGCGLTPSFYKLINSRSRRKKHMRKKMILTNHTTILCSNNRLRMQKEQDQKTYQGRLLNKKKQKSTPNCSLVQTHPKRK